MYELVITNNGVEKVVHTAEDRRLVELARQRHFRSFTVGEAFIREAAEKKTSK